MFTAAVLLVPLHLAAAQTVLNLSANGSNTVDPDRVTAALTAQVSSPNPAFAQDEVNREMALALAAAKALAGVTATTADYNVYPSTPDGSTKPVYQASQTLQLDMKAAGGVPPVAFTALLGQLQQKGLLLNNLAGDLSNRGQEAAQQGAIDDAIRQIQAQAQAIAADLGQHVGKIQALNVNVNMPGPVSFAPKIMMMAAAAPQAAPAQVSVQATVSATIGLTPPP